MLKEDIEAASRYYITPVYWKICLLHLMHDQRLVMLSAYRQIFFQRFFFLEQNIEYLV
jgi:hypothetical protein